MTDQCSDMLVVDGTRHAPIGLLTLKFSHPYHVQKDEIGVPIYEESSAMPMASGTARNPATSAIQSPSPAREAWLADTRRLRDTLATERRA